MYLFISECIKSEMLIWDAVKCLRVCVFIKWIMIRHCGDNDVARVYLLKLFLEKQYFIQVYSWRCLCNASYRSNTSSHSKQQELILRLPFYDMWHFPIDVMFGAKNVNVEPQKCNMTCHGLQLDKRTVTHYYLILNGGHSIWTELSFRTSRQKQHYITLHYMSTGNCCIRKGR